MERIVVFDAYGTLFKINLDNLALHKVLGDQEKKFMEMWRHNLLSYSWLYTIIDQWVDFNTLSRLALQNTCNQLEIQIEKVSNLLLNIYETPTIYPDVHSSLSALLSKGVPSNILSNGNMDTLIHAVSKNNLEAQIAKIFSAETVRKFKIHPEVYKQVPDFYSMPAEQCYFISSNTWDIAGAINFGFKTIWLNRNNIPFEKITTTPHFIIQSLSELPEII